MEIPELSIRKNATPVRESGLRGYDIIAHQGFSILICHPGPVPGAGPESLLPTGGG